MDTAHHNVLLIGASRGLGRAIAAEYLKRGAHVVATVRGNESTPLHELVPESHGELEIEHVDITDTDQLLALRNRLSTRTFDLLFVNAGTTHDIELTTADIPTEKFARVMATNALGPLRAAEVLGSSVAPSGTIAIMSSGQGSVANNNGGGWEIYRASKAAVNQLTRSYAARHAADDRTLLLMAPGWVQTEMGGPDARLTIDESIPSLVSTVDSQRGHGGLQFLDYQGRVVPW